MENREDRIEMLEKFFAILLIFMLGALSSSFASSFSGYLEEPLSLIYNFSDNLSPSDYLEKEKIVVYPDKVVIKVSGASVSSYASTGSMRPVLDSGANGIRVVPKSEEDIHVGDIISFKTGDSLIIHRVIEKGMDDEGVYFITKGDNNSFSDGKIRFKDIDYLTIAIIY